MKEEREGGGGEAVQTNSSACKHTHSQCAVCVLSVCVCADAQGVWSASFHALPACALARASVCARMCMLRAAFARAPVSACAGACAPALRSASRVRDFSRSCAVRARLRCMRHIASVSVSFHALFTRVRACASACALALGACVSVPFHALFTRVGACSWRLCVRVF